MSSDDLYRNVRRAAALADDLHNPTDFMDYTRGHGAYGREGGVVQIGHLIGGLFASDARVPIMAVRALVILRAHLALHDCFDANSARLIEAGLRSIEEAARQQTDPALADAMWRALDGSDSHD